MRCKFVMEKQKALGITDGSAGMVAQVRSLAEAMELKLKQILTGEQFDKWQKQREKMRQEAKERWQERKQQ